MILFSVIVFALSLLLLLGWRLILEPLGLPPLPLGALMVMPLIYFGWRRTFLFVLSLSLIWEASAALPFGWVAVPLTAAVLLLQAAIRHQIRAGAMTLLITGVALQSFIMLLLGLAWPPKTIAGAVLQTWQTGWQLAWAAVVTLGWLFLMTQLAKHRFNLDLDRRLKDL